jgi:hypothetical protein
MNNGIAISIWLIQATIGAAIVIGVALCVLWHIAALMGVGRAAITTSWRFGLRDLLAFVAVVAILLAFLAPAIRP